MAKAFVNARGLTAVLGPLANKVMYGRQIEDGDVVKIAPTDGEWDEDVKARGVAVEKYMVTYSTGMVDAEGRDIYTGDYVRLVTPLDYDPSESAKPSDEYLVFFDEDTGAFYMAIERGTSEYTDIGNNGDRYYGVREGVYHFRLDTRRASGAVIVGNIYDAFLPPPTEEVIDVDAEGIEPTGDTTNPFEDIMIDEKGIVDTESDIEEFLPLKDDADADADADADSDTDSDTDGGGSEG